jgi:hypothetical protein
MARTFVAGSTRYCCAGDADAPPIPSLVDALQASQNSASDCSILGPRAVASAALQAGINDRDTHDDRIAARVRLHKCVALCSVVAA